MANTLTDLKDVKIAQTALMPWMQTLLPLTSFSTNFSPEAADKLDTIKVPVIGAPSSSSTDFAGDYTANADSSASSVPVVLNKHKVKTVHMTAKEAATTAIPLLEKQVVAAAQKLAQDVMADIFSCVTEENFGDAALSVKAEDFSYSDVIAMRKACGMAKMPVANRHLILNSPHYSSLLGDETISQSTVTNIASGAIKEGEIKRVVGFTVHETDCIPDNDERLAGFAVNPSAIAIAMRYLEPVAKYDEAGAVTDPTTGLTFGYLRYSDTKSGLVYITLEAIYGYSVLRGEALLRLTEPDEDSTDSSSSSSSESVVE